MNDCPGDHELATFLDGALTDAPTRTAIEAHLDHCSSCRETVGHATTAAPPRMPRVLVRYRLDDEIGRGGMGVVWRAWDVVLERVVAVKLVNRDHDDQLWRQRALREARALAQLHHPNVIDVYDAGEADGEMFITTELIDGDSLDRWQPGQPPEAIIDAYVQAARGLEAAHALGIVHRDVKPSNIFVARSGRVCVGDFGLATSTGTTTPGTGAASSLQRLTHDGAVVGTPAYMAPEQRRGGVDARADQYSLCVALAEALLGKTPDRETIAALTTDASLPWSVIAKGMAELPDARFASVGELADALASYRSPRARRRRGLAVAGTLLALVVIGIAVYAWTRPAPEPPPYVWSAGNPWSWATTEDQAWRLSVRARQIAIIDADTAIVLAAGSSRSAVTLDRKTGVTTAPFELIASPAEIDDLAHIGGHLLAVGREHGNVALWEVPGGQRRALVEIGADRITAVAVAPDGNTFALCLETASKARVVVVEGTATRELALADCDPLVFSGPTSVATLDHEHDLATAQTRTLSDDQPIRHAGPGGQRVVFRADRTEVYRDDQMIERLPRATLLRWTPDGTPITIGTDALSLRPHGGGVRQTARIDLANDGTLMMALDDHEAILVNGFAVQVVDLERGTTVHRTAGTLQAVAAVAPSDGELFVATERLRSWRPEEVVQDEPFAVSTLVASAIPGRLALGADEVAWWDSRTRTRLAVSSEESSVIAVAGEEMYFATARGASIASPGQPSRAWFELADAKVVAISPAERRIVTIDATHVYLIDLVTEHAWAWRRRSTRACHSALRAASTALVHGRAIIRWDGALTVLEPDAPPNTYAIAADAIAAVPTGEVVLAYRHGAGLWTPHADSLLWWDAPVRPGARATAVGVDARGLELATGFDTGEAAWGWLPQIREHAKVVSVARSEAACIEGAPIRRVSSELVRLDPTIR